MLRVSKLPSINSCDDRPAESSTAFASFSPPFGEWRDAVAASSPLGFGEGEMCEEDEGRSFWMVWTRALGEGDGVER